METLVEITLEQPPIAQPLYRLQGVQRIYHVGSAEVRAVDGVELELYPGELVAIEGPSGSGKSTMLQLLGALDQPTRGSVFFDGRDLATMAESELTSIRARDIGFIFQSFNLIPTLTASENVEMAMVPLVASKDERRRRAVQLLGEVGLAGRVRHLPTLLSGGEQQRVAIARAMANRPRVILADEPTGNLDTTSTADIGTILRRLAAHEGVTIILVTHSGAVAAWARRRFRMRDGKLTEWDPAAGEPAGEVEREAERVIDLAARAPVATEPEEAREVIDLTPGEAAPEVAVPGLPHGISGVHVVFYSPAARALRDQLGHALGWPVREVMPGVPLFALPPAELGVHQTDAGSREAPHHEVSLMCDDITLAIASLKEKGVRVLGAPQRSSFGTGVMVRLAGGLDVLLLEPSYPRGR